MKADGLKPPPALSARFFSPTQRQQVAAIFEAIWPGGPDNPGAGDARAADYLDLLLGCDDSVYYEIPLWRPLYVTGLAALNAAALSRPGLAKPLEQLSVPEMTALLKDLEAGELTGFPDGAWQKKLFSALRAHAIEGCLAHARWGGNRDDVIWKWLGYPNGQAQDSNANPLESAAAMNFTKPDAIIVGSGAGGGTAAKILTARGWNVVVMEKGQAAGPRDFLPFDELHYREHKTLIPKKSDDPMIYAGVDGKTPERSERWWEATMVGGSTMIWDAYFTRYTRPDFDVLPYLKDVPNAEHMVKWPWTYEEFLPYIERAETEWCVSGDATQSPEEMRSGYQYPMPPLKPHMSTDFLMGLFGPAGLQPYLGAHAINSETFDGRPACTFCGFCQFFGCTVDSRANSTNTVLRKALATGRCELRTGHYVTRVEHEPGPAGRRRIRGVSYVTEPGGPEKFLEAHCVIVSVQTIQSTRLFLLSAVPDPNKLIGRFLTYHAKGEGHYVFPNQPVWDPGPNQPQFQPVTAVGSLQLRGLYTYKDENGAPRKGGKFSVYDPFTCTTPLRLVKAAALAPDRKNIWGADLIEYLKELRSRGGVSVSFTGDAMSLYDNRVELDPVTKDPWGIPVAKTFYRHDPWELAMSKYVLKRITEVVVNAGGEVRKHEPQDVANPGYGHVHGALRAGKDRGASVLNENCEAHEVKGLYVLDAAWMPTAGASNPSLTLIANAIRVCDQIPKS